MAQNLDIVVRGGLLIKRLYGEDKPETIDVIPVDQITRLNFEVTGGEDEDGRIGWRLEVYRKHLPDPVEWEIRAYVEEYHNDLRRIPEEVFVGSTTGKTRYDVLFGEFSEDT